jgi:NADH-quinone oxidoreductase subunit J
MDFSFVDPGFRWAVFGVASVLSILCSIMMVTRKNPIHSALWLIVTFFSLAVIYLVLNAQFIAIAQVMVYAGAIMMLIIFVIMLIQLELEGLKRGRLSGVKIIGTIITVVLFLEIIAAVMTFRDGAMKTAAASANGVPMGTVASVGTALYGKFLFPFEVASILLLIGVVGAVVLARKKND